MRRDSQGERKGGIKGKALFSSQRARALSCEAELSVSSLPCPRLWQESSSSLATLSIPDRAGTIFQCPSKMFAMMLSRAILPISFALSPSSPGADPELLLVQTGDKGQKLLNSERRKIIFSTNESRAGKKPQHTNPANLPAGSSLTEQRNKAPRYGKHTTTTASFSLAKG